MRWRLRTALAWRSLRRDWPGKLGAVAAALVLWWVASSDPGTTAQRSLLVPLEVVGAQADEVPVGVPARVEVVIAGPADRMDRLRADEVDAAIDLTGVDGEFSRDVEARVPNALRLIRVVPAEVLGRVEAVRSATFEIEPLIAPLAGERVATSVRIDPPTAVVEARDPILSQVASVFAPARPGDASTALAELVAVDVQGRPVPEARVVPEAAVVAFDVEPRRVRFVRPVAIASTGDASVSIEAVTPPQVGLIGPADVLDDLRVVQGSVPDATSSLPPGRYDLPARLELPSDVSREADVVVTVRIASPPNDPEDGAP